MDNLRFWNTVSQTDLDDTQPAMHDGQPYTSIRNISFVRRATEQFGMFGVGWGFKLKNAQTIKGQPIYNPDGTCQCFALTYSVDFKFWFMLDDEEITLPVFSAAAPFVYIDILTGNPRTNHDHHNKAVNNGIKRAMMMLGFSADIYTGKYDNPDYIKETESNANILNIEAKGKTLTKESADLLEWCKTTADSYSSITISSALRRLHIDNMKALTAKAKALKLNKDEYSPLIVDKFDSALGSLEPSEYTCMDCSAATLFPSNESMPTKCKECESTNIKQSS